MLAKRLSLIVISVGIIFSNQSFAIETPSQTTHSTINNLNSNSQTIKSQESQSESTATKPVTLNQIVAIVNNDVITSEQLNEAVHETKLQLEDQGITVPNDLIIQRQVLQQLINQNIMLALAKRNHIDATDSEVNQLIETIADQNHITVAMLKNKLKESGIDYQQYFKTMHKQMIIQKMQQKLVSGSIFVSPSDISNYVNKHLKKPDVKKYDLSNILIPLPEKKSPDEITKAKASAEKLVEKIKTGKITFFEAAREYSQSGNALSGGSLGLKTLDDLPSIYANKAKEMKKGEVIGPFEANGALQILKLNDIKVEQAQKHWIDQYHTLQILIKLSPIVNNEQAKAQLERIIMALDNGKSFESLAKSNTQNYDVASKGGDLGWVNLNQIDPELANMVKKTPIDKVSDPFQVGDTWQIIKVVGKRKIDNTEDYLKMQAANTIYRQRAEQMVKNWKLSIRGEAYIKILVPELNMPDLDAQ